MTKKNLRSRILTLAAVVLLFVLIIGIFSSCKSIKNDELEYTSKIIPLTNQYRTVYLEMPDGHNATAPYYINDKIFVRYITFNNDTVQQIYIYDKTGAVVEKHEIKNEQRLRIFPSYDDAYFLAGVKSLVKMSYDGETIFEFDLFEYFGIEQENSLFHKPAKILCDDEYIYLYYTTSYRNENNERFIGEYSLLVLTHDGKPIKNIDLSDFSDINKTFYLSPDGGVIFYTYKADYTPIIDWLYYKIDIETGEITETEMPPIPDIYSLLHVQYNKLFSGTGLPKEYDSYYKNDDGLYGYNVGTEPVQIVSWDNSNISSNECDIYSIIDTETILCMLAVSEKIGDYRSSRVISDSEYKPVLLVKVPEDELKNKTILTMAIISVDDALTEMVYRFNQTSDKYFIVLDEYTSNGSNFIERDASFDLDLANGFVHDLVCIRPENRSKYVKQGLFADLYGFYTTDSDVSADNLLGNVRRICEDDGHLYLLPTSYSMYTLAAKTSVLGESDSLTVDELVELRNNMSSQSRFFTGIVRQDALRLIMQANMNHYIDYETATCNFDDEGFMELLELIKPLPTITPQKEEHVSYRFDSAGEARIFDIRSNTAFLLEFGLREIKSFLKLKYVFGDEDYAIKGYPTAEGNGSLIQPGSFIGVNARSENQEGAWEFMKFMLSDDIQLNKLSLPLTNSALDATLYNIMSKGVNVHKNMVGTSFVGIGDELSENYVDGTFVEFPFTEEDADDIRRFLNDTAVVPQYDEQVMWIILEEVNAFFADDITVDMCAKYIDNRVGIYISEQFG